ncbi:glycosyltransferase family 39 protein [Ectobacillus panaciterrae]|uniref:glycosyltransferase family 39 protein n=1 Tax=Ectobacillus panaciterrae TaxID=363872 RepID=UPI000414AA77|nr:glycosyltransferase family 39 protein [Ectobacillus panaciterrae]
MSLTNLYKWLKSPLLYILIFALFINMYFLIKNPGDVFHNPKVYGEGVSAYGSVDAYKYASMAWQLLHDGIYGYAETKSNAYVTPGHPLYLAAIFKVSEWVHMDHILLTRIINMLLNIGIVFIIYNISQLLFRNIFVSSLASLMYTTYFSGYHFFRTLLTEIPSMFLFMLTILIFILALRKETLMWHIIFGIVASITLMFRPAPAPLLLIGWGIIVYKSGWKEAIKIGFIWCIGPVLIMGPWVLRNLLVLGHAYIFSSHSGDPLLAGTDPFYLRGYDSITQDMVNAGYTVTEENKGTYAKILIKNGFKNDFALWFSWFTLGKTIHLFNAADALRPLYDSYFASWVISAFKLQHFAVVLTGLASMITFRKNPKIFLLSTIVIGYVALSNIFLAITRYGFFIIPCLCILGAFFIVNVIHILYKRLVTIK